MIKFQSHVPSFIDTEPAIPKRNFNSLEDLLNHPWIKGWNKGQKDFRYCYGVSDGRWSKSVLMVSFTENEKPVWWVIGYMDKIPNLPRMTYPETLEEPKEDIELAPSGSFSDSATDTIASSFREISKDLKKALKKL